jgi:glycerol-3-phosphate dehydrogenase
LPGGSIDRVTDFLATASETPGSPHLARLYGSRIPTVTALALSDPGLRQSLSASGDIGAQIALAMREEMALTLEDVVMRRTGIGQLGDPGRENIESAATLMARELGWSETRKRAEIENIAANFRTNENAL